jgi:hypothetical protein
MVGQTLIPSVEPAQDMAPRSSGVLLFEITKENHP